VGLRQEAREEAFGRLRVAAFLHGHVRRPSVLVGAPEPRASPARTLVSAMCHARPVRNSRLRGSSVQQVAKSSTQWRTISLRAGDASFGERHLAVGSFGRTAGRAKLCGRLPPRGRGTYGRRLQRRAWGIGRGPSYPPRPNGQQTGRKAETVHGGRRSTGLGVGTRCGCPTDESTYCVSTRPGTTSRPSGPPNTCSPAHVRRVVRQERVGCQGPDGKPVRGGHLW
jgi:hypothetical protein